MSSSLRACEGLVWLIGAVVCLLIANRGFNCLFTRAKDGRIARCGIISSCLSVVTSEIVKALLVTSSFHLRSAIASTELCLMPLPLAVGLFENFLHSAVLFDISDICKDKADFCEATL